MLLRLILSIFATEYTRVQSPVEIQINTGRKCTTDSYYDIRHGIDEHNIPITNKQQINNTPNSPDVYNVLEALKRVIWEVFFWSLQIVGLDCYTYTSLRNMYRCGGWIIVTISVHFEMVNMCVSEYVLYNEISI